MKARRLVVLALALGACGGEPPEGDGAPVAGSLAAARGAGRANADGEVQSACDSAAARWSGIAGAVLERGDTLLAPGDVMRDMIGDSVLTSLPTPLPACHAVGTAPAGLDSASEAALYWPARDWGFLWRLTADGPDGQVETFQRDLVRCQVSEEWDGGDDSDSTYVPDPFYRERTRCWHHPRGLIPADTAPWRE